MTSQSICLYRLVPPSQLIDAQEQLGEILFQVRPGDQERQMSVSTSSGCLYFVDSGKLWANAGGSMPRTARDAEVAARKFIEASNRRASGSALPTLAGTTIFPTDARLILSQPVFAPERDTPDHWLCSFMGYQPTGLLEPMAAGGGVPQTTIPVLGAHVDVRIGADSEVVGVWSSWRPVRAMELVEVLPAPRDADAQLFYQGGGHNEPQEILAPYYMVAGDDDDTAFVYPASRYSLLVQVSRQDSGERIRLSAEVTGNTGPVTFAWGAWSIDMGPAAHFGLLGSSASIELPPGAYNVILDVEDQVTRAFARSQYAIYCGPAAGQEE
jgi:hypothetical protein